MTDEHVKQLLEQQKILIETLSKSKEKDRWIVIGIVGIYFTTTFKAREPTTATAQVRIAKDNADDQAQSVEGSKMNSSASADCNSLVQFNCLFTYKVNLVII